LALFAKKKNCIPTVYMSILSFCMQFLFYFTSFSTDFLLFRFVSKQICVFRLFRYRSEKPKRTETNRNKNLLVSRNKPKMNRNRLSFGLFRFEPKKFFVCFEDTLEQRPRVKHRVPALSLCLSPSNPPSHLIIITEYVLYFVWNQFILFFLATSYNMRIYCITL
jgi:hypothetical protein